MNFPIMRVWHEKRDDTLRRWVPWEMVAEHEAQARHNHDQSLARLAERGGLDAAEAVAVLEDRDWHHMSLDVARARLEELVAAFEGRLP